MADYFQLWINTHVVHRAGVTKEHVTQCDGVASFVLYSYFINNTGEKDALFCTTPGISRSSNVWLAK